MTVWADFERFLLPEKEVSLKLVFDNVRNYLICGALLGMAFWFESGKATAPPFIFRGPPKDGWQSLTWAAIAAFLLLFFLNAYQSYVIGRRMLRLLDETKRDAKPRKLSAHVYVLMYLLALVLTLIMMFLFFSFALLAIYLSWFAAVGAPQ